MMNELCNHIESSDFCVLVNIVSGFNTFLGVLENHDTVLKLIALMNDWRNQVEIADRIDKLTDYVHPCKEESPYDVAMAAYLYPCEKESPYDAAIAAYLYILATQNMALAYKCSDIIYGNFFWTTKMIDYIKGKK